MPETAAARMNAIWDALQDGSGYIPQHPQAFVICAIIIVFVITAQFESIDTNRFSSRFLPYSSIIQTENIAGRLLINVAMIFFIVINLTIFWLLCLFPSVFVGLAKVYSSDLANNINDLLESKIQTPIIMTALWLGISRFSLPGWLQISSLTCNFFQERIDVPSRFEETVILILTEFESQFGDDRSKWIDKISEFASATWKAKNRSILSLRSLERYYSVLKIEETLREVQRAKLSQFSMREIRHLFEQTVVSIILAAVPKAGWRGVSRLFSDIANLDKKRWQAFDFINGLAATTIVFSIGMVLVAEFLQVDLASLLRIFDLASLLGLGGQRDTLGWITDPPQIWSEMAQYAIPLVIGIAFSLPLIRFNGAKLANARSKLMYLRDFFRSISNVLFFNWVISSAGLFLFAFFAIGIARDPSSTLDYYWARLTFYAAVNGISCSAVLFCISLVLAPSSQVVNFGMIKSFALLLLFSMLFAVAADTTWCTFLYCVNRQCGNLYEHRLFETWLQVLVNSVLFLSVSAFFHLRRDRGGPIEGVSADAGPSDGDWALDASQAIHQT
jgi:hypothetical protein